MTTRKNSRAFTLVEFLVLFGILIILLSIFIPYLMKNWEIARRTQCSNNLRQIYSALKTYAASNASNYPRVIYDEANNPTGYTAFTGVDDANPFAPNSTVQPNDVTASLWLLVREKLIEPRLFICPSSDDSQDLMTDANGLSVKPHQRGNFRRPANLSYSYSSPFSNAPNYRMDDARKGDFALLADKSPGIDSSHADIGSPAWNAPTLALSRANSRNHGRAGQNVLYTGFVRWEKTPYCGVQGDNIYTALSPTPLIDRHLPPKGNGYWGHEIGAAWEGDSYLVPTANDLPTKPVTKSPATSPTTAPAVPVVPIPATQPTRAPTTTSTAPTTTAPTTLPSTSPSTRP